MSREEERKLEATTCFACGNPEFEFVSSRRQHRAGNEDGTDAVVESWCDDCGTTSYVLENNRR